MRNGRKFLTIVMAGLDPAIHSAGAAARFDDSGMDPGVKPRGDGDYEGGAAMTEWAVPCDPWVLGSRPRMTGARMASPHLFGLCPQA